MNNAAVREKITAFASSSSAGLKKLWNPLSRILTFSLADDAIYPARIISASLEKGLLSVIYGSRFFSHIRARGIREYYFDEDKYPQPEVFASSLSLAMNDLRVSRSDVSFSIPKAWAVIRTAQFPATVKENLSNVISYEMDRITPFRSVDAFYDFRILGEDAGKITVLVAAAKADVVQPYIDALKGKGLSVGAVTVNLSGIETLCRYMERKSPGTDFVFVETKKEGYEGALFLNGAMTTFAGNFPEGDDRAEADLIVLEIARSVEAIKQHGGTPRVVLLLRDKNPTLKELLKSRIDQPLKILNETDMPLRLSGQYKEIPYAAIGSALESLWKKAKGFNLLSKGVHEKLKPPMALTIILIIAILGMWILYIIAPLRVEEKRLQEIDRQISLRKEEVNKIETLKKEINALSDDISTVNGFKENKPMALNILKELTTILPKNTWVTRVRITESGVNIEGYSSSATGLLSKIEASHYFKKTEFASPTFRDTRMNADRFNIKTTIVGFKKDEAAKKEGTEGNDEE
jgi:Tfp pilus assembly protein PilN